MFKQKAPRGHKRVYLLAGIAIVLGLLFITSTFLIECYAPKEVLDKYWMPNIFMVYKYVPFFPFGLAVTTMLGLLIIMGTAFFLVGKSMEQT
mgnify:CR=1 FL=1